jgi:hypothetical protein
MIAKVRSMDTKQFPPGTFENFGSGSAGEKRPSQKAAAARIESTF